MLFNKEISAPCQLEHLGDYDVSNFHEGLVFQGIRYHTRLHQPNDFVFPSGGHCVFVIISN